MSVERLPFIQLNALKYLGPISVAYYVKEISEVEILSNFLDHNIESRNYIDFHIVYAKEDEEDNPRKSNDVTMSFPINFLRNIARKYSKTNYFLYLDADFIVSNTLYRDIHEKNFLFAIYFSKLH